jgi:hypothetical protein
MTPEASGTAAIAMLASSARMATVTTTVGTSRRVAVPDGRVPDATAVPSWLPN